MRRITQRFSEKEPVHNPANLVLNRRISLEDPKTDWNERRRFHVQKIGMGLNPASNVSLKLTAVHRSGNDHGVVVIRPWERSRRLDDRRRGDACSRQHLSHARGDSRRVTVRRSVNDEYAGHLGLH